MLGPSPDDLVYGVAHADRILLLLIVSQTVIKADWIPIAMAIARCVQCWPPGPGHRYALAVEPVGYPDTALICGTSGCQLPALLWLRASEAIEYHGGRRIFTFPTRVAKIRVVDSPQHSYGSAQ